MAIVIFGFCDVSGKLDTGLKNLHGNICHIISTGCNFRVKNP